MLALKQPASHILVTGGTGMIGTALCRELVAQGHSVTILSRSPARAEALFHDISGRGSVRAVSSFDQVDIGTRIDAVVNLAGEPLGDSRWTTARVEKFFESRVGMTHRLVEFLANMPVENRPNVLISGSAIGYYGVADDSISTTFDEGAIPVETQSMPHRLCAEWEAAATAATGLGVRVVPVRIGVVLGSEGGALAKMILPFKLGVGGRMGTGNQIMSWIHIQDLLNCIVVCINDDTVTGPVNATAPNPVTNNEFTKALGRVVNRPAVLPVPAAALKLIFGEMADALLLSGVSVVPKRLTEDFGYKFVYETLEPALKDCV